MASLAEVRTALTDTITGNIHGLFGYPKVPETINTPAFLVRPGATDFMGTFARGLDKYDLDIIVLVSRRDDGLAQNDLDPFIDGKGTQSIRQVVFTNEHIGLTDGTQAVVTGMADYGAEYTIAGIAYLGARLTCTVTTSGTA